MNMSHSEKPLRDIEERTFKFAVRVIKLCQFLEGKSWVNSTLGRQLLRCGTSIGSNVEEAQAAQSRADFISKNSISLKEARETHYRLRLLAAAGVIPRSRLQPLLDEALELKRILGAIIISSKNNPNKERMRMTKTFSFFLFPF